MEDTSEVYNIHNYAHNGRQLLLPPRSPVPSTEPFSIPIFTPRNELRHHRTSSEGATVEEQPSWIDDLVNEPVTPMRRVAHRRSSSDSFSFLDVRRISSNLHIPASPEYSRSVMPQPSWGALEFDSCKYLRFPSYYHVRPRNRAWETYSVASGKNSHKNVGSLKSACKADRMMASNTKKQNTGVSANQTLEVSPEMTEDPPSNTSHPDAEQKRIKQTKDLKLQQNYSFLSSKTSY